MSYVVEITEVASGLKVRMIQDSVWDAVEKYCWAGGNFACSCNRSDFFHRALGIQKDSLPVSWCGVGRYVVRCLADGDVVYEDVVAR